MVVNIQESVGIGIRRIGMNRGKYRDKNWYEGPILRLKNISEGSPNPKHDTSNPIPSKKILKVTN